ncbi:hypothetical protein NQ315_013235 [Exocentrus adspersus]|uniref:Uncharacterized protein n=1 Tax=Exocentrus adspersus TaxID=1586481 RepID=A0AAV8V7G4_9CUCU|nr:hypothetical protein NQ315_013235 [Exocentrus adspersus]
MVSCVACGLSHTARKTGITFHKFPRNPQKRKLWLNFVDQKPIHPNAVLCSQHFKETDFEKHTSKVFLTSDAVPSTKIQRHKYDRASFPFKTAVSTSSTCPLDAESACTTSQSIPFASTVGDMVIQIPSLKTATTDAIVVSTTKNNTPAKSKLCSSWLSKIKCRTCLKEFKRNCVFGLQTKLSIGMTVQQMLLLFVPEMVQPTQPGLIDFVCNDCMKAIRAFVAFLERFNAVEEELKSKESDIREQTAHFSKENDTSRQEETGPGQTPDEEIDNTEKELSAPIKVEDFNETLESQYLPSGILQPIQNSKELYSSETGDVIYNFAEGNNMILSVIKQEDLGVADMDAAAVENINNSDSIISTLNPTLISSNKVTRYDRVVSISANNPPWQSPPENRRILLLGNAINRCPECKITFPSEDDLKYHFLQVHPSQAYPQCDDKLEIVKADKWSRREYNCPVCNALFYKSLLLNKHMTQNHKDYFWYSCDKCGRKFKKKFTYKLHVQNYERFKNCNMQTCRICKEVIFKDEMKKHYETHKDLQCVLCNRRFLSQHHYKRHLAAHDNKIKKPGHKAYVRQSLCPICGKLFGNVSNLETHMTTHSQDRNYMCDQCPKTFKTRNTLRIHHNRIHVLKSNNYMCATCGTTFKSLNGLRCHINLKHSDVNKHLCQVCGAAFKRGDYYRNHMKKHTNAAPSSRRRCGGVPRKYRIRSDRRCEEPLTCKYCSKKFMYIFTLRAHLLKSHISSKGSTEYKCQYCDLTFSSKDNKRRHEKTHADPELFALTCVVCHCRFSTKEELETHSAKHAGSTRRICDLCGEAFPSKYLMVNHKRYAHFNPKLIEEQQNKLLEDGLKEYMLPSDEHTDV